MVIGALNMAIKNKPKQTASATTFWPRFNV
jgi:hypothetical protein